VGLCLSIIAIRRDHPHHVYDLWYIFSLTLCAVSILFFYWWYIGWLHPPPTFLYTDTMGKIAYDFIVTSTNAREELYVLLIVSTLLIVPQALGYLLSGIFGCGSPPILVSMVAKMTTWSLIKFFCILSGILTAQTIAAFYAAPLILPKDAPIRAIEALFTMFMSFLIMALYYEATILYNFIIRRPRLHWFESFSRFMTRSVKITKAYGDDSGHNCGWYAGGTGPVWGRALCVEVRQALRLVSPVIARSATGDLMTVQGRLC
jgi:hypothetical protein